MIPQKEMYKAWTGIKSSHHPIKTKKKYQWGRCLVVYGNLVIESKALGCKIGATVSHEFVLINHTQRYLGELEQIIERQMEGAKRDGRSKKKTFREVNRGKEIKDGREIHNDGELKKYNEVNVELMMKMKGEGKLREEGWIVMMRTG